MRTVRSTIWTLVVMAVVTVGVAALATAASSSSWHTMSLGDKLNFDPTSVSLTGLLFSQLIIGVLGVLVMSAEYGTGTIRATLSAIPRRPVVLAAKVVVFGTVAVVVSEIFAFTAFAIGQAILSAKHAVGASAAIAQHAHQLGVKVPQNVSAALSSSGSASIGQPNVLRAVVGAGLYLAVLGLMALGLATIIRHTAGAISAFVGVVLVLPLIVQALPATLSDAVERYLPANIGLVMFSTEKLPDGVHYAFSPWTGFAILVAYTVAILAIGCWVLVRRDA
jgi:hypothetical protein